MDLLQERAKKKLTLPRNTNYTSLLWCYTKPNHLYFILHRKLKTRARLRKRPLHDFTYFPFNELDVSMHAYIISLQSCQSTVIRRHCRSFEQFICIENSWTRCMNDFPKRLHDFKYFTLNLLSVNEFDVSMHAHSFPLLSKVIGRLPLKIIHGIFYTLMNSNVATS